MTNPKPQELEFLLNAIAPDTSDKRQLMTRAMGDQAFLEAMKESDEVFRMVMSDEEILLKISPDLYFEILLINARKEMKTSAYTLEPTDGQYLPVFDVPDVTELLERPRFLIYLSQMLASFVRINSHTVSVRIRKGVRRRTSYNDMDIDSLIRFGAVADEENRFAFVKRIADVCLFSAGIYPVLSRRPNRFGLSADDRASNTRHRRRTFEELVETGQRFYGMAKRHATADVLELSHIFELLENQFTSALKPLTFISNHYLHASKTRMFRGDSPVVE